MRGLCFLAREQPSVNRPIGKVMARVAGRETLGANADEEDGAKLSPLDFLFFLVCNADRLSEVIHNKQNG